eukprot:449572-Rhodomonas_salina.1
MHSTVNADVSVAVAVRAAASSYHRVFGLGLHKTIALRSARQCTKRLIEGRYKVRARRESGAAGWGARCLEGLAGGCWRSEGTSKRSFELPICLYRPTTFVQYNPFRLTLSATRKSLLQQCPAGSPRICTCTWCPCTNETRRRPQNSRVETQNPPRSTERTTPLYRGADGGSTSSRCGSNSVEKNDAKIT